MHAHARVFRPFECGKRAKVLAFVRTHTNTRRASEGRTGKYPFGEFDKGAAIDLDPTSSPAPSHRLRRDPPDSSISILGERGPEMLLNHDRICLPSYISQCHCLPIASSVCICNPVGIERDGKGSKNRIGRAQVNLLSYISTNVAPTPPSSPFTRHKTDEAVGSSNPPTLPGLFETPPGTTATVEEGTERVSNSGWQSVSEARGYVSS
jgi:hypothetical protein